MSQDKNPFNERCWFMNQPADFIHKDDIVHYLTFIPDTPFLYPLSTNLSASPFVQIDNLSLLTVKVNITSLRDFLFIRILFSTNILPLRGSPVRD